MSKGYTIPAWIQTVLWGLQPTTEVNLAPNGIDTFNDCDTHITEQTNTNGISVQGSKGWDQSMGHCHCNRTSGHESKQAPSGAREALHPAWDHVIRCIFPISIYEIILTCFLCLVVLVLFSDIYFWKKKNVFCWFALFCGQAFVTTGVPLFCFCFFHVEKADNLTYMSIWSLFHAENNETTFDWLWLRITFIFRYRRHAM